jgi:hypothetical protein
MKKLIVCILAVLYIGSSTGATVHLHYCMGKLVAMKLWHPSEAAKCSKCGMKKNTTCAKSCCKDEHKTIKLEKDQKPAQAFLNLTEPALATVPVNYTDIVSISTNSIAQQFPVSNAPPRSPKVQTHILHCSFRI